MSSINYTGGAVTVLTVYDCIGRDKNCFFVRISAKQRTGKRTKKQFRSRGIQSSAGQTVARGNLPPPLYTPRNQPCQFCNQSCYRKNFFNLIEL